MDPYVSVVVTAYNRKKYLPEALRSLERQTLDKGRFEVVVVKNFEDPASDEIIRRNGWRWVYSDEKSYGRFLLVGAEDVKGGVLTFLDDDDMYAPERLQVVERAFRETEGLAYFHNDQIIVDEEGRPLKNVKDQSDLLIESPSEACDKIFLAGYINNSSTAVASWLIANVRQMLNRIETQLDLALAAAAASTGGKMLLSGRKLTMWRIHRASYFTKAVQEYGVNRDNWKEAVARLTRTYALWAADTARILENILRYHPCSSFLKYSELTRRLEASAAPNWALAERPRSSPLDFLRVLDISLSKNIDASFKYLVVLAVDSVISRAPNSVRETWWRLRWRLKQ